MINLEEITNAIQTLENGPTTYESCHKLATLYAVRDELLKTTQNQVVDSTSEVLPQYKKYCLVKKQYQMNETTIEAIYPAMQYLCVELKEFLYKIYNHTDTAVERDMLKDTICNMFNEYG